MIVLDPVSEPVPTDTMRRARCARAVMLAPDDVYRRVESSLVAAGALKLRADGCDESLGGGLGEARQGLHGRAE